MYGLNNCNFFCKTFIINICLIHFINIYGLWNNCTFLMTLFKYWYLIILDVSDRTSEAWNLIVDQIVTRWRGLRNNCADDADREWRDDFYNPTKRKRKDLEVQSGLKIKTVQRATYWRKKARVTRLCGPQPVMQQIM